MIFFIINYYKRRICCNKLIATCSTLNKIKFYNLNLTEPKKNLPSKQRAFYISCMYLCFCTSAIKKTNMTTQKIDNFGVVIFSFLLKFSFNLLIKSVFKIN